MISGYKWTGLLKEVFGVEVISVEYLAKFQLYNFANNLINTIKFGDRDCTASAINLALRDEHILLDKLAKP
jgi:hypothetical protein